MRMNAVMLRIFLWVSLALSIAAFILTGHLAINLVILLSTLCALFLILLKNRTELINKYQLKKTKIEANPKALASAEDFAKVAWLFGIFIVAIAYHFAFLAASGEPATKIDMILFPLLGKISAVVFWSSLGVWILAMSIEFSLGYFFSRDTHD
jgi:hypothetical protein